MTERTQLQDDSGLRRGRELSTKDARPPAEVPGYQMERFLGGGAYGEVWVATDQNTGRQVAIKFFTRGAKDWSLLSREVEKLVALSTDRYVVQLLEVGWEMFPPYYVMELMKEGSLDDELNAEGTFEVGRAVAMFRELAVGLMHLHGRGILHCDLKPANVLLDDEGRPRLADFGQSRLVTEQAPALGTLFFMAPEQADLRAVPDARWDVYALGAILYTMLTGGPPHRTDSVLEGIESATDLQGRLVRYREGLKQDSSPRAHRSVDGVDRALSEIIERALAVNPHDRYPTTQSLLEALDTRDRNRAKRPIVLLGLVMPLVLLGVMAVFTYVSQQRAKRDSRAAVLERAGETGRFASRFVAEGIAREMDGYVRTLTEVARDPNLGSAFLEIEHDSEAQTLLEDLADPTLKGEPQRAKIAAWQDHPARQPIERFIAGLGAADREDAVASFFTLDVRGTNIAGWFAEPVSHSPMGENFAWRGYYNAGTRDLESSARPPSGLPPGVTLISPVFQSTASNRWKMAITRPVLSDGRVIGYIALTLEMGTFLTDLGQNDRSALVPGDHAIGSEIRERTTETERVPAGEIAGRMSADAVGAKTMATPTGTLPPPYRRTPADATDLAAQAAERAVVDGDRLAGTEAGASATDSLGLATVGGGQRPILLGHRSDEQTYVVLQHPRLMHFVRRGERLPDELNERRFQIPTTVVERLLRETINNYRDPLDGFHPDAAGADAGRQAVSPLVADADPADDAAPNDDPTDKETSKETFDAQVAAAERVRLARSSWSADLSGTGGTVTTAGTNRPAVLDNANLVAMVLQNRSAVLAPVEDLSAHLIRDGIAAFVVMGLLILLLWLYVVRVTAGRSLFTRGRRSTDRLTSIRTGGSRPQETVVARPRVRRSASGRRVTTEFVLSDDESAEIAPDRITSRNEV